jgi:hypothetical protein
MEKCTVIRRVAGTGIHSFMTVFMCDQSYAAYLQWSGFTPYITTHTISPPPLTISILLLLPISFSSILTPALLPFSQN